MASPRQKMGGRVLGVEKVIARLNYLAKRGTRSRILRRAVSKASTPIMQDARRGAAKETGALKLSMGRRMRTYPSGTVLAIVGPRTGFKRVGRGKKGTRKADARLMGKFMAAGRKGKPRLPHKYAHLVEFGTRPHALGKGSRHPANVRRGEKPIQHGRMHPGARPKPFMRPAWDHGRQQAQQTIARVVMEGIQQELARSP